MKDEYDFKDAVRGKYASRFREGPPTIHRVGASEDLTHEILKQYLADALAASQRAEFELFFLWSLEGVIERSDLGANRVRLLLEGQKESGAPLERLWEPEAMAYLQVFRTQRNWLVHECLVPSSDADDVDERLDRLEAVSRASRALSSFLHERLERYRKSHADGPSLKELEEEARAIWLRAA